MASASAHGPWHLARSQAVQVASPNAQLDSLTEKLFAAAGQLGRELMITSGTVTNRIDGLEAAGLVRRCDAPADRRSTLIALTAAGRRRIDGALADHLETEQALLTALSESSKAQLASLLRSLLLALGDAETAGDGVGSGKS